MQKVLCGVVSALLVVPVVHAQDKTSEIDKIFSWVGPNMPGCVAAASQHGKLVVNRAYGLADLERGVPISPDTLFDVASIRKQFIAAAVLLLVEEKRLSLSDDVRKHVPELPDYGHTITLDHMLTHTSGLRDWVPLQNWANNNDAVMTMILRQRGLNFAPGEEWSYSNSGYVLLAEVVARTTRMTFSEFARTRLFEPLGMKATIFVDDLRQVVKSRALAYERAGKGWRMDMRLDDRGGGALFSTAGELIIWNDALTNARLGTFVSEKLQEPATLGNGRKLDYARGLMLTTNYAGRVIYHGGGAAGYRSILGRFPEPGMSIAVLCNAGEASDNRDDFAGAILDLFMSPTGKRPAPAAVADAPVEGLDVKSKAGLFFNERTGDPIRLIVNGARLAVAAGGPLVAVTKDRFRNARASTAFMSQDQFELTFLSADQFELKSMEGQTTGYRRARPYAPSADDLKAFAGRYESDELRAELQITPGKGGLLSRLNDSPTQVLDLSPVDPDTFQRGMQTVRFVRDTAGTIVALELTNPALRKIRFTRVSQ